MKTGIGMTLVIVALCATTACQRRVTIQAPQPLDPLSAQERADAEKLVRADARAGELLGTQASVASIEFLAVKAPGSDEAVRHVDLLFARPDADFGVRAVVRLGPSPAVTEFARVDRRSVPMTEADVQQAWQIALADPAYKARLSRDPSRVRVEALRIYSEDPADPCSAGRCFYVIVREGDFYVSGASVTVDLATRRVLPERSPAQ